MWLVIVFMGGLNNWGNVRLMFRQYPKLRTAMQLAIMALLPAAVLSTISFRRGWLMAAIGGMSYVVPAIGIAAGFAFLRRQQDILRLLKFYIIVNCFMLISVPMEYAEMDVPALGGINYDWIRYHEDKIVDLMSGWYRSPDIMGLHAAQVIMFSLLLVICSRAEGGMLWVPTAVWAAFAVFVSGRRKMIGIPLVFVATFLIFGLAFKLTKLNRLTGTLVVVLLFGAAAALFIWSPDEAAEHSDFAATLLTQSVNRTHEIVVGSVLGTIAAGRNSGAGLGMATQLLLRWRGDFTGIARLAGRRCQSPVSGIRRTRCDPSGHQSLSGAHAPETRRCGGTTQQQSGAAAGGAGQHRRWQCGFLHHQSSTVQRGPRQRIVCHVDARNDFQDAGAGPRLSSAASPTRAAAVRAC
ncbi:MAG: hypothetical protein R3C59_24545 [Planctomycetaceae bacterium]